MTINEMYDFLYIWVNTILNTEKNLNIPIIFSNQNSPRPIIPYFVIHRPPISNFEIGKGNWCKWEFTNQPLDEGHVEYSLTYQAIISLEEISNTVGTTDGQTLKYLIDLQSRDDILALWHSNKMSLQFNTPITSIPDITENYIEKRTIMDITILYNVIDNYDPSYIGETNVTGNYT